MNASVSRPEDWFSPDYATARTRFRAAAEHRDARLFTLPLAVRGPRGETLTTDIAWLGAPHASHVLLHTSGLHGVEAYAGSAVQLALLDDPQALPAATAMVLVHVLNPYGMAWVRRANENNVDLNRNFEPDDERQSDAHPVYARLDRLLNPRTPPQRDAFILRALLQVLRHGRQALQQAVAQGQYAYPQGLFYGGARMEPGPRQFMAWLALHLNSANTVLAVDLHTGLGARGADTLLTEAADRAPANLANALGAPLVDARGDDPSAYVVRGGLAAALARALAHAQVHAITQEFGTEPMLRVIAALRTENRWHFHGDGGVNHPAKRELKERLCPAAADWRRGVIQRGVATARGALAWLHHDAERK